MGQLSLENGDSEAWSSIGVASLDLLACKAFARSPASSCPPAKDCHGREQSQNLKGAFNYQADIAESTP